MIYDENSALVNLSKVKTVNDLINTWILLFNDSGNKKLIISLDEYEKTFFPIDIIELLNQENGSLLSYFDSNQLYFLSDDILQNMIQNKTVDIKIDYSISLDTNYSSYIHKFIKSGLNSDIPDDAKQVLSQLISGEYRYDNWFYLFENYKNSFLGNNKTKEDTLIGKYKMYENLVSLELFKNIDKETYLESGKIVFTISELEAQMNSDVIFNSLLNSERGTEVMNYFNKMQRMILLTLIGIFKIRYGSNKNTKNKMSQMFRYTYEQLGVFQHRELIIAHKFFENEGSVRMFSKINKGMKKEKVFRLLNNFAWDFVVPRVLERLSNIVNEGDFYIPFFLTLDTGLKEVFELYKVKGILYNTEENDVIPFTYKNSVEYFKEHNLEDELTKIFGGYDNLNRLDTAKNNFKNDFDNIDLEFDSLSEIMKLI